MNTIAHRHALHTFLIMMLLGFGGMAHGIEEPEHVIIGEIGAIEIRHYGPVIQAVTALPDSGKTSEGFRRLAGFIFGGNEAEQKIAMTAPVQESLGTNEVEMAFTMPGAYSMQSLPTPTDPSVSLIEVPARTVAIIEFSGWATQGKIDRYSRQLQQALRSQGIDSVGAPMLNQYNPPWTPPFLRRNEVMLEIILPEGGATAALEGGSLSGWQDELQSYKF